MQKSLLQQFLSRLTELNNRNLDSSIYLSQQKLKENSAFKVFSLLLELHVQKRK